ncbi:hypothetical protein KKB18_09650, partial [bacterium]|nr:hypothetical protein [bacterium]
TKLKVRGHLYIKMGKYGIYLFIVVLSLHYFYLDMRGLTKGFDYQITKLSTGKVGDILNAAEYLNKNCSNNSFVMTSITAGFFLDCPHASLLQSAAFMGYKTVFFSETPDKSRFYFDLTYSKAKYFVVLDVDRNWTLTLPGVTDIVKSIRKEKWKLVFKKGEVEIYENPNIEKTSGIY